MKVRRLSAIAKVFTEEGLSFAFGGAADGAAAPQLKSDTETAARLRRTLERLGPTFVKFGQLLATRVDLFSDEFCQELGKLHSSVPPFANDVAFKIIEDELQRPLGDVFTDVSERPVAAASIAQVYKARLKSDGTVVAIKVQRPDLETSLVQDLEILVHVSGWIDTLVPVYKRSMIHLVAKEYAQRSRREIQFLSEAAALERFGELFGDDPYFHVPKAFRELCSDKLIVMEWIDGVKLDTVADGPALQRVGFAPKVFAQNLLRLQVCMSYEHGFVHADTHPGNIILMPTGKVALIDFGLHAHVAKQLRLQMIEVLVFQSEGRYQEAAEVLVVFSPPANPKNLDAYKADLVEVFKKPQPTTGAVTSQQLIEGLRIGAKYRNTANSEMLMIVRNLAIVEGINLKIYPELETNKELKTILQGIMERRMTFSAMQAELKPLLSSIALTVARRPDLLERLMKMERSFAQSKSLGDFLRSEGVLKEPEKRLPPALVLFVVFVLGVVTAVALRR